MYTFNALLDWLIISVFPVAIKFPCYHGVLPVYNVVRCMQTMIFGCYRDVRPTADKAGERF